MLLVLTFCCRYEVAHVLSERDRQHKQEKMEYQKTEEQKTSLLLIAHNIPEERSADLYGFSVRWPPGIAVV